MYWSNRSGKNHHALCLSSRINTIDSKLLTAEDPVEYDVEGIIQVPVNESIGLTFSRVLRAFLGKIRIGFLLGK